MRWTNFPELLEEEGKWCCSMPGRRAASTRAVGGTCRDLQGAEVKAPTRGDVTVTVTVHVNVEAEQSRAELSYVYKHLSILRYSSITTSFVPINQTHTNNNQT